MGFRILDYYIVSLLHEQDDDDSRTPRRAHFATMVNNYILL